MQQCFATGKGHVADFAVSLSSLKCVLFVLDNQIYIRLIACFLEASAALLGQVKVASLCGASAESCALKYILLLSRNKYRDIHLVALLRKLSCFLEASAALLGQVQVCILVAHQQSCRALNLYIVLDKQLYRDICLIALLRILSCFLEASAALLSHAQVSGQSPVEP